MTRHRLTRALAAWCATGLTAASLAVVGVATAPSADAAAPPGTPWTWGENSFGQLGDGTTTTRRSGAPVTGLNGVIDLHGGREHVVALKSNGTVWTWGSNVEGQQGRGNTANALVPTQVTSLGTDNVAVEAGHNHTMVLKSNGTIWTFGLNSDGQLGDGSTTTRRSPVQVVGINDAIGIAAGRDMSYAIRPGGQLWAWGRNDEGQVGDGTTTRRLTPVRVGTSINFTNVADIAGGRDHAVAVKTDGSVWAWGENDYGQVGDGTTTDRLTPVPIDINGSTAGMGTASEPAAGAHHSYALRTDGTVASWGRNYRTELGDGTTTSRTRPVNVLMGSSGSTPLSGAVTIGSGRDMGIVTLADGRVMAWGHNLYGQLGDGTTTNRTRAIVVPGVTNAVKSGGGGSAYGVVLVGDSVAPNQNPVAHITGTTCSDLSCPLSGSTSTDDGNIVSYAWNFGDGSTGTGISPGHTYGQGGTYTVTLTVTDNNGATDGDTTTVAPTDPGPPPPNQDPVAHITGTTCSGHVCPLSGSTSTDDGSIVSYAWDFGDGSTGTGVSPGHTYSATDTYTVTLTVTDNQGATGTDTASVTTNDTQTPSPSFRASAASDANTTSAAVVVPTAVVAGDQLVLVATNNNSATQTTPAGWTLLGSTTDGTEMRSSVFTRTAPLNFGGTTVRVALSTISKTSLSLLAYADAAPVTVLANAVQGTTSVNAHPAPAVNVAVAGSAVVRYWCDKASDPRTWTTSGVTNRTLTNGTGGGSLSAITGDSTGVPAGTAPALNATSSLASNKAITWSIVVPHS